jgi:N-methylhydantoinase B
MYSARTSVRPAESIIDPITLEVIRHGLLSAARQIDANITRTAFSPYIYEYKDYAVGLVDAGGSLIAQNTGGMPIFVADSVGMAVRDGLEIYGIARLHHGDVLICNHASVQGQHLNNVVMYTPIFSGAERSVLIGFFAINMHWIRYRRIGSALHGYLHGRFAVPLDQAVVEGRADRRGLPHHRE